MIAINKATYGNVQSETEKNIKRRNVLSSFRRQTLIIREKFKENSFICRSKKKKKIVGNQILNVRNFKVYIGIYII